ncbi:hypothetical protein B0T17DRAFT_539772 [Bombardia bombarda]|uniref:magnesium chelatase n=1 Tax=Bombardia bombarda TaxID=252184 RepID=A0AA39WIF5_9PEZI|nr:hypothetical protein B0T17DRAFT_539772 [Bombardia bombarda]
MGAASARKEKEILPPRQALTMAMSLAKNQQHQLLLQKIHSLSDLELAALLCLIAREHCLISTNPDSVDELAEELRLIAIKTFGLTPVIVNCHAHTTLDDFATALLVPAPSSPSTAAAATNNNGNGNSTHARSVSPYLPRQSHDASSISYFPSQPGPSSSSTGGPGPSSSPPPIALRGGDNSNHNNTNNNHKPSPQIANVILAKNLDLAPRAIQIQALELLRTRRIFTRTSVHPAPKQFLLVAIVGAASGGRARVTAHLNDFFYMAHWHDADEDGFASLDEEWGLRRSRAGRARGGKGKEKGGGDHTTTTNTNDNNNDDNGGGGGDYSYGNDGADDSNFEEEEYDAASTYSGSSSVVKKLHGGGPGININPSTLLAVPDAAGRLTTTTTTTTNSPSPLLGGDNAGSGGNRTNTSQPQPPHLSESDIAQLAQLAQSVRVDVDVARYQMNIIAFLRMHRAVAACGGGSSVVGSGVTPAATKHFEQLARSLAPLHGLDYVTPSLVGLAAHKVYLHRVNVLAAPSAERERSMQWGSELAAVEAVLEAVGAEEVIGDVLGMVGVPY